MPSHSAAISVDPDPPNGSYTTPPEVNLYRMGSWRQR
jgi:hypothetical protein